METVSFIIPTTGRDSLQKTLSSIHTYPGDEVLVIEFPEEQRKGWGGRERNEGIERAKCDYLSFIDDDDWYVENHREIMHLAATENVRENPILFRMQYPSGRVIWDQPVFRCGNVGTCMIFIPNVKENFPVWGDRHCADFNFLNSLGWQARKFIFRPEVIAMLGHEDERYWKYNRRPDDH